MFNRETQQAANWGGSPSPIHHWMEAMLRLAAMCLGNLARLFVYRPSNPTGECDACPEGLPASDPMCDPIRKEPDLAAQPDSRTTMTLMLVRSGSRSGRIHPMPQFERRTTPSARASRHEGAPTAASSLRQPARRRTGSSHHQAATADFSRPDPAAGAVAPA